MLECAYCSSFDSYLGLEGDSLLSNGFPELLRLCIVTKDFMASSDFSSGDNHKFGDLAQWWHFVIRFI